MTASWKSLYRTLLILAGLALTALSGAASAGAPLGPVIPPAQRDYSKTQRCVRPVEDMRKNHFKYLLHHRDQVVHEGIRTPQFNLQDCINCHATRKPDGQAIRIDSPGQFCFNCHKYAGVQIDCFECHSDLPSTADSHFHKLGGDYGPHHIRYSRNDLVSPTTLEALATKGAKK